MIEVIFILAVVTWLVCRAPRQQGMIVYQPQRHYYIRETFIELPDGTRAVHRELERHD